MRSAPVSLACANLGKRSILLGVQINLESLLAGADLHLRVHAQLKM